MIRLSFSTCRVCSSLSGPARWAGRALRVPGEGDGERAAAWTSSSDRPPETVPAVLARARRRWITRGLRVAGPQHPRRDQAIGRVVRRRPRGCRARVASEWAQSSSREERASRRGQKCRCSGPATVGIVFPIGMDCRNGRDTSWLSSRQRVFRGGAASGGTMGGMLRILVMLTSRQQRQDGTPSRRLVRASSPRPRTRRVGGQARSA